jgi:O-antigen ligase
MPALTLFLAFLLWILLGIGVSPLDHGSFLKQWTLFVDYVAVAVLTINVLSTRQRMSRFIDILLVVPLVMALYGIYGYLTHHNVIVSGTGPARITSFFQVAPALALFLSNVIPLALYRVFTTRKAGRVIAFVTLCALLAALGLTFSRGAIIGVILSLVIAVLLLPSRRVKLAALGLASLAALVVIVANVPLFARFFSIDLATVNGRTYLWQAVLANFDPGQLLGNGLGASNALLAGLASSGNAQIAGAVASSPSNLYVGTLYDHGIIGLVLLLVTFVALAVGLIRGMRRATGEHRVLFVMALVTLVSVIVQSFEQNDILAQSIGVDFWIVVALPFALHWSRSGALSETVDESRERATSPRASAEIPARGGAAAQG